MEELVLLLEQNPSAFGIKLALFISSGIHAVSEVGDAIIARLVEEIKRSPDELLLYLPFLYFPEVPVSLIHTVFPLLPQTAATLIFVSETQTLPLYLSAAKLALRRPFSLENFAICSRFCADDLLYRSHLKNAFKYCLSKPFSALFRELYLQRNYELAAVLDITFADLEKAYDFRRFQIVFQVLGLQNSVSDVFNHLQPQYYMFAIYTYPQACSFIREQFYIPKYRLTTTEIGAYMKQPLMDSKLREFLLQNIDLLLLRFTSIDSCVYSSTNGKSEDSEAQLVGLVMEQQIPRFWNLVPPNRRDGSALAQLTDDILSVCGKRCICKFSVYNALGKILLAFAQLESAASLERCLQLFETKEIEGISAQWYPYVYLLMALFNESTRFLASEKLRFALQSEIFAYFDDFPGVLAASDLDAEFQFSEIVQTVVVAGTDSMADAGAEKEDFSAVLSDIDVGEILYYDDDMQFVYSRFYSAFFELFATLKDTSIYEIYKYRETFLGLLCYKAVLATFRVNFIDAAPAVLVHVLLRFLEMSFSEELPLSASFLFHLIYFPALFSLFFQEDETIRGAAGRVLAQEARSFANFPALAHCALTPQQASFVLETTSDACKLQPFYAIPETIEAVALALTLENALYLQEFAAALFYIYKYYRIACFLESPSTSSEIFYYEVIYKRYFDYISRAQDLTSVLDFLYRNFVAPPNPNAIFIKALRLFDAVFSRARSVEFRVKTGILTFANGILGLQRGKYFTAYAVKLYLKVLSAFVRGHRSSNLCEIASYVVFKMIATNLDYFAPETLDILQLLCFCDYFPANFDIAALIRYVEAAILTNEQFYQLIALFRLYVRHVQLGNDVVQVCIHILDYLAGLTTLLYYNCVPLAELLQDIYQKIQLLIQPNVEEIATFRSSVVHLQKLLLQELYYYKSEEEILQRRFATHFTALFLQLLKTDFVYIAEGRMIETRKNQRAEYISRFTSALFLLDSSYCFREFLRLAKKASLAQFFASNDGVLYFQHLVCRDPAAGDCVWTCYDEYLQYLESEGPKDVLLRELVKIDIECLSAAHLDLLNRLTSNEGDFYQRKRFEFLPFNFCFDLLSNALQRSDIERILMLKTISNLLDKSDISREFVQLCKKVQLALNFQGAPSDRVVLAFLCHVRNCMDANDMQKTDVLPGSLMKCVKEILE